MMVASVGRALRSLVTTYLGLPMWLRALAPMAAMASLWVSSSSPPVPRPPNLGNDVLHNSAHIVAYGLLAGSFLLSGMVVPPPLVIGPRWWPLLSVVASTAYGVVDELHQSHVPGRVCSFGDLLSDASGGALAVTALLAVLRGEARLVRWLPWCAIACMVSVAIATWLPW